MAIFQRNLYSIKAGTAAMSGTGNRTVTLTGVGNGLAQVDGAGNLIANFGRGSIFRVGGQFAIVETVVSPTVFTLAHDTSIAGSGLSYELYAATADEALIAGLIKMFTSLGSADNPFASLVWDDTVNRFRWITASGKIRLMVGPTKAGSVETANTIALEIDPTTGAISGGSLANYVGKTGAQSMTGPLKITVASGNALDASVGAAMQMTARIAARSNGDSFEFGHTNSAGYGSSIGAEVSSGSPYIVFFAGAGTNVNTYRTRGVRGSGVRGTISGRFQFFSVPAANADNQVPVSTAEIDESGNFSLFGGNHLSLPSQGVSIGYSTSGKYGWIQAVEPGVNNYPMVACPNGNDFYVGLPTANTRSHFASNGVKHVNVPNNVAVYISSTTPNMASVFATTVDGSVAKPIAVGYYGGAGVAINGNTIASGYNVTIHGLTLFNGRTTFTDATGTASLDIWGQSGNNRTALIIPTSKLLSTIVNSGTKIVQDIGDKGVSFGGVVPNCGVDIATTYAVRHASLALSNSVNQNVPLPAMAWAIVGGPTANFSIGGFAGGINGATLDLTNGTAYTMTINNEDTGSTAGNRIATPAGTNLVCKNARLCYDAINSRWRVLYYS